MISSEVTRDGSIIVLSLPNLKELSKTPFLQKQNRFSNSTISFLNDGIGLYLDSPMEIQRFSYTEVGHVCAHVRIDFPRPKDDAE